MVKTEISDNEFIIQFENSTLDEVHFDHTGHLRLAWIYLNAYAFDIAVDCVCVGIDKYATSLGASDKFHVTITKAIMHIMKRRMNQFRPQDFQSFTEQNQDLVFDCFAVLNKYYSQNILNSAYAKTTFVLPNKRNF